MRVAVDTNVLVRYITADDPLQYNAAKQAIEGGHTIVVSSVVLCEVVWVLRSRPYERSPAEIGNALTELLVASNVETDLPAANAGLRMLARGGGFADGVIEYEATRSRCDRLVTFDRNFVRHAASRLVIAVESHV